MTVSLGSLSTNPASLAFTQFPAQPNAQPFTYRSGITYNGLLEAIRDWVLNDLIPFLNDSDGQAQWDANAAVLLAEVNATLNAQAATVNANLSNAVAQVIAASILVSDPVMVGVLDASPQSQFKTELNGYYGLTDAKLLPFFNATSSGDSAHQVRALMDSLYKVTDGNILGVLGETNSSLKAWFDAHYAPSVNTYFAPGIGGDSTARIGDSGSSSGYLQKDGQRFSGACRVIFGSTAIWGASTALTGFSAIAGGLPQFALGFGVFTNSATNGKHRMVADYIDANTMRLYFEEGDVMPFAGASAVGNPPQSSTLIMNFSG